MASEKVGRSFVYQAAVRTGFTPPLILTFCNASNLFTIRRGDDLELAPDVIKIDVEGAEHDVLIGLHETILRHTPTLFVENSDWNNVTPYLSDLGYSPYRWMGDELVPYFGTSPNTFYLHNSTPFN